MTFLPEVYQHLQYTENTTDRGIKNGPVFRCSIFNKLFRRALVLIDSPDLGHWEDFEISWRYAFKETLGALSDESTAHDFSMFHIAIEYIEMAMELSISQKKMIHRIRALHKSTFGHQTRETLKKILEDLDE